MSFRAKKYIDPSNSLVKRGGRQFPGIYDFPFAKKAMTIKIETMRLLLQTERNRNSVYDDVWKQACSVFGEKKDFFRSQSEKPIPDECHVAIIAYTFEKVLPDGNSLQIYDEFNKMSRDLGSEASWIRFRYKSLYCLLAQAVSWVKSEPSNNKAPYYRCVGSHYSADFFDEAILVDFSQYTSLTTSREQALNLIRTQGGKGTLFVLPHPPMAGIGIKNYSEYAQEEEVLICPWSTFKVSWVKKQGDIHEIVLNSDGPYFEYLPYSVGKPGPPSANTWAGVV